MGDLALAEITDLVGGGGLAGAQLDPGADFLAVFGIGHADDLNVLDLGVGVEELLDLAREDVLAAADQHVLEPADDLAIALGVDGGDIATIDAEGYCQIVGRLKDMLIRGGENIFPREIEEFLYTHPKIEDVQVIGVPDPKYGEEVCAWIKLRPGETATADEIRDFCQGKIAHFKIPRYIRFVEEFPMTVTGKVQKFLMRKTMTEELKEQSATG